MFTLVFVVVVFVIAVYSKFSLVVVVYTIQSRIPLLLSLCRPIHPFIHSFIIKSCTYYSLKKYSLVVIREFLHKVSPFFIFFLLLFFLIKCNVYFCCCFSPLFTLLFSFFFFLICCDFYF